MTSSPQFTDRISPEERAEFERLEAEHQAARAIYEPLDEAHREASRERGQFEQAYRDAPTPEAGERFLAAVVAERNAWRVAREAYPPVEDAAAKCNEVRLRLLRDEKLRPAEHTTPFGEDLGPVNIAYLNGWTRGMPYTDEARGGVVIGWAQPGCGFGTLTLFTQDDGTLAAQTECMGADFVKATLAALADSVKVVE